MLIKAPLVQGLH